MNMSELLSSRDNPIWKETEYSHLVFNVPMALTPLEAGYWTLRGWRHVAAHHMVDVNDARYTLTEGVSEEELYRLGPFWCQRSPQSHIGPFLNAIDFLAPDGTPVLAPQEGEIIEVVEHLTEWGPRPEFRDTLNYLTMVHESGELTQYCHLAKDSVSALGLRVGSGVKFGQQIAIVGKTGWTDRDHLHFLVFRDDNKDLRNPFGFKSLIPRFRR